MINLYLSVDQSQVRSRNHRKFIRPQTSLKNKGHKQMWVSLYSKLIDTVWSNHQMKGKWIEEKSEKMILVVTIPIKYVFVVIN